MLIPATLLLLGLHQVERPRPPHIGSYIPSSQLLQWCKSADKTEFPNCWSYIYGVVNAAGIVATTWPKGHVEIPADVQADKVIADVVQHIESQPLELLSKPASEAVYEALVAKYRCTTWC